MNARDRYEDVRALITDDNAKRLWDILTRQLETDGIKSARSYVEGEFDRVSQQIESSLKKCKDLTPGGID